MRLTEPISQVLVSCISIVILLLLISQAESSQVQTFLKFYSRPQIVTMSGGFSFPTTDGKIVMTADVFNGVFAVLNQNGAIEHQRKVTTALGFPIMDFTAYPIEDGEISIVGIAPGTTPLIVYGVLRSDLSPKFIKAVDPKQLPFDTPPSSMSIAKKTRDGYYGFVEFEDEDLFYLVKFDQNGNPIWIREYDLADDHAFFGFREFSDGTFGFAGGLYYSRKFTFARGDLSGYVYTAKSYESKAPNLMFNWAEDLVEGLDGSIYIIGTGRLENREGLVLLAVNKSGDLLFARFYRPDITGYYSLSANRVLISRDGTIYVVGTFDQSSLYRVFILKMDMRGNLLAEKVYRLNNIGLGVWGSYFIEDNLYISGGLWHNQRLGAFLLKLDHDGNLYGCDFNETIKFSVSDITHSISILPLQVTSRNIDKTIQTQNFSLTLRPADLTVTDICSGTGSATPVTSPFIDVSSNHWAYHYILWVRERGISTGYADGTFRPESFVTRQEMSAFLVRAREGENFTYRTTPYFRDVLPDSWSFRYVQRLYELGLTRGCGEGLFCPFDYVTRAQIATFIVRMLVGEDFQYDSRPYFTDVSPNHWAFRYIQKARELGIITGYEDGTFRPERAVTRAEMSALLHRALNR